MKGECSICLNEDVEMTSFPCCEHGCCSACMVDVLAAGSPNCFECGRDVCSDWQVRFLQSQGQLAVAVRIQDKSLDAWMRSKNGAVRLCPNPKCQCPIEGCKAMQWWTCILCDDDFCSSCDVFAAKHKKAKCGGLRLRLTKEERNEAKFIEWVKNEAERGEHSVPCPGCKATVFRSSGCNHMSCPMCARDFCFLCGADFYTPDGDMHFDVSPVCTDMFLGVRVYRAALERRRNAAVEAAPAKKGPPSKPALYNLGPLRRLSRGQKIALAAGTAVVWVPLLPLLATVAGAAIVVREAVHSRA